MHGNMQEEDILGEIETLFTDWHSHRNNNINFDNTECIKPSLFHKALLEGNLTLYSNFASRVTREVLQESVNTIISWNAQNTSENYKVIYQASLGLDPDYTRSCKFKKSTLFSLPLSLAAVSGNMKLVERIIQDGANIHAVDKEGKNVIHDLVNWSQFCPKEAIQMYHFITDDLSPEEKTKLLKQEDIKGRNCLDRATDKFSPEIVLTILNTEGVYKHVVQDCILHKHIYYDVSDYESPNSSKPSPLFLFNSITNKDVVRFDRCHFFKTEPIQAWITQTYKSSGHVMVLWLFLWFVYLGMFLAAQVLGHVFRTRSNALFICLGVMSGFLIIRENILTLQSCKAEYVGTIRFLRSGRVPATLTVLYRKVLTWFSYCCVILSIVEVADIECQQPEIVAIINIVATCFACLSLLYFVHLISSVGHLLVLLLKMLYDSIKFLIIGVIIFMSIANPLHQLSLDPVMCLADSNNSSSTFEYSISETLGNYTDFLYEVFLLLFAIKSPEDDFFQRSISPTLTTIFYTVGFTVASVLLLNMLIGVMSQRITEIDEHRDTLIKLERLSLILFFKDSQWQRFRFNLGILRRSFRVSKDLTKVYIEVIEQLSD